jgi:addiction module HigA family antidote
MGFELGSDICQFLKSAHPGGFIKHEIIGPPELTVTAAATALGVTRTALPTLLNEPAHLSPEMALRLETAFGVPMEVLMRIQNSYDSAQTRKREGEIEVARFGGVVGDLAAGVGIAMAYLGAPICPDIRVRPANPAGIVWI